MSPDARLARPALDAAAREAGVTGRGVLSLSGFVEVAAQARVMLAPALKIARLRDALAASEARAAAADVGLEQARAVLSVFAAMIRHLRVEIARLRRERYGQNSRRRARLIDRIELQLEDLAATAAEDGIAAATAAGATTTVQPFERRRPFPVHLPRERVVVEAPAACALPDQVGALSSPKDDDPDAPSHPETNGCQPHGLPP